MILVVESTQLNKTNYPSVRSSLCPLRGSPHTAGCCAQLKSRLTTAPIESPLYVRRSAVSADSSAVTGEHTLRPHDVSPALRPHLSDAQLNIVQRSARLPRVRLSVRLGGPVTTVLTTYTEMLNTC